MQREPPCRKVKAEYYCISACIKFEGFISESLRLCGFCSSPFSFGETLAFEICQATSKECSLFSIPARALLTTLLDVHGEQVNIAYVYNIQANKLYIRSVWWILYLICIDLRTCWETKLWNYIWETQLWNYIWKHPRRLDMSKIRYSVALSWLDPSAMLARTLKSSVMR